MYFLLDTKLLTSFDPTAAACLTVMLLGEVMYLFSHMPTVKQLMIEKQTRDELKKKVT
jgi:hypothetical protein